jgi:hypothetical protein
MANEIIDRTLWCDSQDGRLTLTQADLRMRTEPLVVLGEAGMGKTRLLEWLADSQGYAHCTARQLINRPNPTTLLGDAQVLVIDALDEVSARQDGEAVDLVLRQLGVLGYPRFVLSCRVADWRSATGLEAIREQYPDEPLELHLDPLDDRDATAFLSVSLGPEAAREVVDHFNARGLQGLLGNPQTLELIVKVARAGSLPETRHELFERAVDVLRIEHRDAKANSQLARDVGLDAAGAASAVLVLTGSEAIVRGSAANTAEGELQLVEVSCLPGGEEINAILGTRLFKSDGSDRFGYLHRRIGEFLGARWLAKQADTPRKRKRLLSMFHSYGLVPASLRGIHAWLARDPSLAESVIAADPMGVIEYGDADDLTANQARALIDALELLARDNPHFRGWGTYSVRGIAKPELIEDLRLLITSPAKPFALTLLVLEAVRGTELVADLEGELREIVLDPQAVFAIRSAAAEALVGLLGGRDWGELARNLHEFGDELSIRLAIELAENVVYQTFSDELIADLLVSYARCESNTVGVLRGVERDLPESKIEGVLSRLVEVVRMLGRPYERPGDYVLTDVAYCLVTRRIEAGHLCAERLWAWLEPFHGKVGYQHETRERLATLIRGDDSLRRAVQQFVLFSAAGEHTPWQQAWRLMDRSPGFSPTEADVLILLQLLDPAELSDERWRDVVQLTQHDSERGAEVRMAARVFAAHSPELLEWVDNLAAPRIHERQLAHAEERRARLETEHARHRQYFSGIIDQMRAGDYAAVVDPAKAYLKLFHDVGDGLPAHERVAQWLGDDLADAAHLGFEAFLMQEPPCPAAQDIADSLAQGKFFEAGYIIVAAFAERHRKGRGFDDLSDERLMAGLFELRRSNVDEHAGIEGLKQEVESTVRDRGIWMDAMRAYHEPQLRARRDHVDGLYLLMRNDDQAAISTELAAEWLEMFQDLPVVPETELIDRLIRSDWTEELRGIAANRVNIADKVRQRNWDAIGLMVDFDRVVAQFDAASIDPDMLWSLRSHTGGRYSQSSKFRLNISQLEWFFSRFRLLWPKVYRPSGTTSGDANPWDASSQLEHWVAQLGNDASDEAAAALRRLLGAPGDGYTEYIQTVVAEQARIQVESRYAPPTLAEINAIACNSMPVSAADLQAFMIDELDVVQAKIRSDDAESWRGFYNDDGVPFAEERCRDHLLGLLRQGADGITLDPEAHVAADKEVDIACSIGTLRMPIEIKGQWHSELWTGADKQLDSLYTTDWRAQGRGIYLVLWFGPQAKKTKQLRGPGKAIKHPQTPSELQEMLTIRSKSAQDGRVVVYVLDITRGQS